VITYLALLRAINVGGRNKVAMADLRDLLEQQGFEDPRTLLQTGNVVFEGKKLATAALEEKLEKAAAKVLGVETDFFVRTADEWKAMLRANPFKDEARRDPSHLVVLLMKDEPPKARVEALRTLVKGPELIAQKGRQLYVTYPDGIGHSRLTPTVIEKALETRVTGRNWRTSLKIEELLSSTP
jgi:uncharacterized protein (DUF1697 family)